MIKKFYLLLMLSCFLVSTLIAQTTIYVSPTGLTSNPGTQASPTNLVHAVTIVPAGGTIFMRGGTYNLSATLIIARGNSGTSAAPKNLFAFTGEIPVLNFSSMAESTSNRGIVLDALFWHVKGLVIQQAGDNGMLLSGNNNIIESCIFRGNRDSGLQLSRFNTSFTSISQWPSNNLIVNCEAFDNKDAGNENADGFAAKLTSGSGNIFRGCISHHNIDDGWDLYTKSDTGPIGTITLENCIAHSNGILTTGGTSGNGDKNGFKLGGEDIAVNHTVRRCIAYNNGKHGFTYNRNLGTLEITNNTSYNNVERNFNFDGGTSVFKNNLSFQSGSNDRIVGNASAPNAFTGVASGFTVTSADFVTLTPGPSANPTANGFLKLASGSDLIDGGVTTTGITFNGARPDLGAIEFGGATPITFTLTVNSNPATGGTITKSPNKTLYNSGEVVTLTATPAAGFTFANWTGAVSGTSASTTVTMSANRTVTANFTATTTPGVALTATAGNGQVTLNWTVSNVTVTSQEIFRDTDSNPAGRISIATPAASARTFTNSALQNGTTYFYWVRVNGTVESNVPSATPQGQTGTTTLRIEDSATPVTGLCSFDGSLKDYTNANNGKAINLSNSSARGITWKVSVAAGTYQLKWRYVNGGASSATTAALKINGATVSASVAFPKTIDKLTFITTTTNVTLVGGVNQIRLETTQSAEFADIDWIEISGSNVAAANCSSSSARFSNDVESTVSMLSSNAEDRFKVSAFPNPSKETVTIGFTIMESGPVSIRVINSIGKQLDEAATKVYPKGYNEVTYNALKAGMHYIHVSTHEGFSVLKLIVE